MDCRAMRLFGLLEQYREIPMSGGVVRFDLQRQHEIPLRIVIVVEAQPTRARVCQFIRTSRC